jgi:hypothetical protein
MAGGRGTGGRNGRRRRVLEQQGELKAVLDHHDGGARTIHLSAVL